MICLTSSGHRFDEHGFASVNCTPSTAKFLRFDEHVFTLSIFANLSNCLFNLALIGLQARLERSLRNGKVQVGPLGSPL